MICLLSALLRGLQVRGHSGFVTHTGLTAELSVLCGSSFRALTLYLGHLFSSSSTVLPFLHWSLSIFYLLLISRAFSSFAALLLLLAWPPVSSSPLFFLLELFPRSSMSALQWMQGSEYVTGFLSAHLFTRGDKITFGVVVWAFILWNICLGIVFYFEALCDISSKKGP